MDEPQDNKKAILGPILGIESEYEYSLIFACETFHSISSLELSLVCSGGDNKTYKCLTVFELKSTWVYKFVFPVEAKKDTYKVNYKISIDGVNLVDRHINSSWTFVVPGSDNVPKIGFFSCNGNSKKLPQFQSNADYVMWDRLYISHIKENMSHSFHCIIMGGDQIYADPMWKNIPYFKDHKLLGWNSNRAIEKHVIKPENMSSFTAQLEEFYERLYIESWGKPAVSKALAAIPSIMMWDDHDIFDGWGSQPTALQESQVFQLIFKIAKKYFEVFQLRGIDNKTRISQDEYSLQIRFRNFEIFVLDNRSHRTNNQIMSVSQFENVEDFRNKYLFEGMSEALSKEKVLLFAIAVPVAHLNYKKRTEKVLKWPIIKNFRYSLNDDALDHWDHSNHVRQQKRLLDTIFSLADHTSPKYVHIISGDVHSAGAGRIVKESANELRIVNEYISSPIVYKPIGRFQQYLLSKLSDEHSQVAGYKIGVYQFGFDPKKQKTIYQRNYGSFYKGDGMGLRVYFTYQNTNEDDVPGQPAMYLRTKKTQNKNDKEKSFEYLNIV